MNAEFFAKRADAVSAAVVAGHLVLVLSPIYAAAALGLGWHTFVLLIVFGLGMNGILNLMHECAHILVFRRRDWSDALGRWLIAPLVFADFDAYRDRHWAHHKFIGEAGDTKDTYLIDIHGLGLLRTFIRCASMGEAVAKFLRQTPRAADAPRSLTWLIRVAVVHAALVASLTLTAAAALDGDWRRALVNAAVAYGAYLYGLMSVTVFMASLRAIAEHHQYDGTSAHQGHAALRNFTCSPISRFLMGAYGFGEHFTHHRVPGIPYYRLPEATRAMAAEDPALKPGKDYFGVLLEIVTAPDRSRQQETR